MSLFPPASEGNGYGYFTGLPRRRPKRRPGKTLPAHTCPVCDARTRRRPRWTMDGRRDERCQRCVNLGRWARQHVKKETA